MDSDDSGYISNIFASATKAAWAKDVYQVFVLAMYRQRWQGQGKTQDIVYVPNEWNVSRGHKSVPWKQDR